MTNETNWLAQELRNVLSNIKRSGKSTISIDWLEKYLSTVSGEIAQRQTTDQQQAAYIAAKEKFEHEQCIWEVTAPLENAQNLEMFISVIESGGSTLRAGMITNGGAAIALLAFLGNTLATGADSVSLDVAQLSCAMLIFFIGTSVAAFAYGLRYITQYCYYVKCTWARTPHRIAFVVGMAPFLCFMLGGWAAYSGFK